MIRNHSDLNGEKGFAIPHLTTRSCHQNDTNKIDYIKPFLFSQIPFVLDLTVDLLIISILGLLAQTIFMTNLIFNYHNQAYINRPLMISLTVMYFRFI